MRVEVPPSLIGASIFPLYLSPSDPYTHEHDTCFVRGVCIEPQV